MKILTLITLSLVAALGCDDDAPAACLPGDPTDCAPLYEPTFVNIYERTLLGSCAVGGAACHGNDGTTSGFQLPDRGDAEALAGAHTAVLAYVVPGDAVCSPLSTRLDGVGADQMPPGASLDAASKCAIRQWIADGAAP